MLRNGQFTVGKPIVGQVTRRWVCVLAYPVRDRAGKISGALGMSVDLARFRIVVSPVELPGNSIITIIDHDGTVIMRSPGSQNWIGKATRGTEIVDLVLAGDQGQKIGRGVDGKQRIYGFATIPKSGWKVYAGIPTSFVLAAARANTWRASVAAGALFALNVVAPASSCPGIPRRAPIGRRRRNWRRLKEPDSPSDTNRTCASRRRPFAD